MSIKFSFRYFYTNVHNGITLNKGFFVSVTACQHIKFRNLTYVAIFVDMQNQVHWQQTTKAEMGKFQYFTASLHGK